jgi:hypothetical protein
VRPLGLLGQQRSRESLACGSARICDASPRRGRRGRSGWCAGRRLSEVYEVLELVFDRGSIRLTCHADTDEIAVDTTRAEDSDLDEIGGDDSLGDLLGKTIEEAWTMANNRGYRDAFQLRCIDLATRSEACRQFEAAAAAIWVREVST